MKHLLALALVALLFSSPAKAAHHTDEDQVLAVVNQFFVGLKERDLSLWQEILVPEGTVMVSRNRDGEWAFTHRTIESDLARLEIDTEFINERIYNPTVLIQGTIAVVWTPYDIYVDGNFIHCGIDVFQLLKVEGNWKIVQLAYTVDPEGCEALGVPPRE